MNDLFKLDTQAFPEELNVLLRCIGADGAPSSPAITAPNWENCNEQVFIELAHFHRLYPMFYAKLKDSDVPAAIMQPLKKEYMVNAFHMLRLTRSLDQLFRLFQDNQIRALLLKGPALAQHLYGDTSLRTCKDLDILISLDEFDRTEQLLYSIGFTLDYDTPRIYNWKKNGHHCNYSNHAEGVHIEIHWRLNPGSWLEPTFDELWSRKEASFHANNPIYRLGDEDLLLYLSVHGARHSWFRLRWLLDIAQLLEKELNWHLITELMQRYSYSLALGQALNLCNQLLATPLHADAQSIVISAKIRQSSQTAVEYIARMEKPNSGTVEYTQYLLSLMTFRQKLSYLNTYFYPSAQDALTLPLPPILHFLYFPIRPFLALWRRLKRMNRAREF